MKFKEGSLLGVWLVVLLVIGYFFIGSLLYMPSVQSCSTPQTFESIPLAPAVFLIVAGVGTLGIMWLEGIIGFEEKREDV
jgi:hypothetical protein